ncbi:hypothetical protein [Rhodococcus sp. 14-2483-1-2]|uniref:hypothetical protein n=1 Tax=Rhodococcus sp. 14-2483-1-2 TaxID=2023147 RepID=UPI001BAFC22C|nr:hypothetical protein [Rhodococcus sp. 14-2483-1-2]
MIIGEAEAADTQISIDLVVAGEAWSLFQAGDLDGYIRVIAESAFALDGRVEVIVLAQASMAPAEGRLLGLSVPVLSSPRLAVEHAAKRLRVESDPGTGSSRW